MASNGQELLGEHYEDEHLTHEDLETLGLEVVTEDGGILSQEELRGRIFRIENRDEPSGYVVKNMEITGQSTTLCYLQKSSGSS